MNKLDNIINNWSKVEKETYQITLELAKERLSEKIIESESITNKSIKMLILNASIFSWFLGNAIENKLSVNLFSLIPPIINLTISYWLISPRETKEKGLAPSTLLPNNFDKREKGQKQLKLVYFHAISIFQENIDTMSKINRKRAIFYKIGIIISFLSTILFIISIMKSRSLI